jgi:hypothetical protein
MLDKKLSFKYQQILHVETPEALLYGDNQADGEKMLFANTFLCMAVGSSGRLQQCARTTTQEVCYT